MKKYLLAIVALLLLSSCEVHHFISDSGFRLQVEKDFDSRMADNPSLKEFCPVDSLLLTTEEKEALKFLYAE